MAATTNLGRLTATLALGVAVVLMGSVFTPSSAPARNPQQAAPSPADAGPIVPMGTLQTATHLVEIYGTPAGARYTIAPLAGGPPLAEMITAEEARSRFPEVRLATDFSAPQQLMMVTD